MRRWTALPLQRPWTSPGVRASCHKPWTRPERIRNGRRSPEEWEETLNAMLNEGAPLSDADYPVVLAYLSKNFAH